MSAFLTTAFLVGFALQLAAATAACIVQGRGCALQHKDCFIASSCFLSSPAAKRTAGRNPVETSACCFCSRPAHHWHGAGQFRVGRQVSGPSRVSDGLGAWSLRVGRRDRVAGDESTVTVTVDPGLDRDRP
jgi:hypothetical protein